MAKVYLLKRPAFFQNSPVNHHGVKVGNTIYHLHIKEGIFYEIT
jgi:hypothetical protein